MARHLSETVTALKPRLEVMAGGTQSTGPAFRAGKPPTSFPRCDAARSDCCRTERSSGASAVCTGLARWLGSTAKGHRRIGTGGLAPAQPNLGHLRAMVLRQNEPVGGESISKDVLDRPVEQG